MIGEKPSFSSGEFAACGWERLYISPLPVQQRFENGLRKKETEHAVGLVLFFTQPRLLARAILSMPNTFEIDLCIFMQIAANECEVSVEK